MADLHGKIRLDKGIFSVTEVRSPNKNTELFMNKQIGKHIPLPPPRNTKSKKRLPTSPLEEKTPKKIMGDQDELSPKIVLGFFSS